MCLPQRCWKGRSIACCSNSTHHRQATRRTRKGCRHTKQPHADTRHTAAAATNGARHATHSVPVCRCCCWCVAQPAGRMSPPQHIRQPHGNLMHLPGCCLRPSQLWLLAGGIRRHGRQHESPKQSPQHSQSLNTHVLVLTMHIRLWQLCSRFRRRQPSTQPQPLRRGTRAATTKQDPAQKKEGQEKRHPHVPAQAKRAGHQQACAGPHSHTPRLSNSQPQPIATQRHATPRMPGAHTHMQVPVHICTSSCMHSHVVQQCLVMQRVVEFLLGRGQHS